MRPGPATSSPPCCPSSSGSWAPEHPDTLTARANLARWTGEAGDAAGARDQYAALLPVRERVLGPRAPRHPDRPPQPRPWTGEAGDAAGARDQFAALLPVSERVLGPEHPDTLTARDQPRPLDRGGGGCGRGPRPVRRPAAHPRAGPGPRTPAHPDRPARASPAGPGRRGMRPGPGISTPPCCPSANGSRAPSTPRPGLPATTSPTGPGRRGRRLSTRPENSSGPLRYASKLAQLRTGRLKAGSRLAAGYAHVPPAP